MDSAKTIEQARRRGQSTPALEQTEPRASIGVDLGGTHLRVAVVDAGGSVVHVERRSSKANRGPDAVIADMADLILRVMDQAARPDSPIGVGVAGQVTQDGVVELAPNLGWRKVPLQESIEAELDRDVVVVNDVRAATWAEWQYGAGKGSKHIACLFVGTGVGGGLVMDGRLLSGCNNALGEFGHMTLIPGGRDCHTCGNPGCLESYVGGWAIGERAREAVLLDARAGERMLRLAGGEAFLTAAIVSRAYAEGDPLAGRLVRETAEYLGAGMVSIVNALNPCLVVMGGGVIEGAPALIALMERYVRRHALPVVAKDLSFAPAVLGGDAGVVGAAGLATSGSGEEAGR